MKAIRLIKPHQPLEIQEIPKPEPGPRDVLVRVKAAGICHSDAHYRAGVSPVNPLPLTLGHEVAGVVEEIGAEVTSREIGDRVCLHYMVTCGDCAYCAQGSEQFCASGQMLGKNRNGGYAEYILIPARNAFLLPEEIPFAQGAIMMCSSATSFHALRKGRVSAGDTVAVFGVGGLGMSAVQLAPAFGALDTFAVDINPAKLKTAEGFGAIPVNAAETDPVEEIKRLTGGRGVDVALELIGLPLTVRQSIEVLAVFGRAVMVGLSDENSQFNAYEEMICREAEIIGSADHLARELPTLIEMARRGTLDLSGVVSDTVPLDADAVNETMDRLESFSSDTRVVIAP
ncbi:MAG: alcohol dehydrogenase [Chloroflexi bacterium]|nr:alcohol dehydrogenase [Chloroflexota bacterium]